ncbi:MAG: hypothetical protein L0J96_10600 [Lactococcus lactis]|nr:hypothetical protein [Lactococcus lactis]MDN5439253.1 hypothetical protein [Lactococcus lactis]MDN5471180.1 hypothetical protein [Lactococcus lactis]MDN5948044.1 hypothetical protein [Lactococcus lactis]MDN5950410.1 hypothetical protein [Lactococcus lactis]
MTQETEKERIYREALDEINNLAIDVAMDFEETGIDSVDCGKIMDIVNKAFFAETNQQPSDTDKLSVEKLQEQLNTAKNALTEIAYTRQEIWRGGTLVGFEATEDAKIAYDALAAIGWDGCPVGLIVKNGLTKEEIEGSDDE